MTAQRDSRATLVYMQDLPLYEEEKPYVVLSHLNSDGLRTNLAWESGEEERLENLRGREDSFTLDGNGFCFRNSTTSFDGWTSRQRVEEDYLPEVVSLLKEYVEGVDEVDIFDWRIRCSKSASEFTNMNDPTDPLNPALEVHVDQSPMAVVKRVKLMGGARADFLLRGRVRIINVWRPLHTVEDWPLALCDGTSVSYNDLMEVDLIRKNYIGKTMYAKFRRGYRWYYLDSQMPQEVCFFKNFDSNTTVPARGVCPHVSFSQSSAPSTARARESIEVRAIVYTYPTEQLNEGNTGDETATGQ